MLMPVPDRAPALFRAGDLGVSAEWRDISYDWSPLLTPDGVYIYSYLRDTYDQQRSLYPFLLIPEGPTKKKIQTRLGLKSAYAMHGPEFLLTTVGLLHVDVTYGQGADPERPNHTHVAYYVVGRLDHPVLDWPMLERVLDALMIALTPAATEQTELRWQKKAEAALRALGQAGLLQDCDPEDLFYELGAWPTLLPTLIEDQRWVALFSHLHGTPAMQRYRRQARVWAEYAQRYVVRLEQENLAIRDQVLAAQRRGPRRVDATDAGSARAERQPSTVIAASSQVPVTEPREVTSIGCVTGESPARHQAHEVTSIGSVTADEARWQRAQTARSASAADESPARDQLIHDRCRRTPIVSTASPVTEASASDSDDGALAGDIPLIEPHLRDSELGSSRFDAYFWCAVNEILQGSRERYDFSPGEKQAVFRQFKRQHVAVGAVLAALRASTAQLPPGHSRTLADVLKMPLFHACLQRALALLPARTAGRAEADSWPAFLAAYRRVGLRNSLRDVSVPDYNVLHGLFMKQPAECWDVLSRIEHMAELPELSPRYLQRAIVNNQRAAAEGALIPAAPPADSRRAARTANQAARPRPADSEHDAPRARCRALLEQEGLKPQLLTEQMTPAFIEAWIAEADARRHEIKSRPRWLIWGLTSGALPEDHPTLPPRVTAHPVPQSAATSAVTSREQQLWAKVLADLERRLPASEFETWIKETSLIALEDDQAVVSAANIFVRETIERTYGALLAAAVSTVVGRPIEVQLIIASLACL